MNNLHRSSKSHSPTHGQALVELALTLPLLLVVLFGVVDLGRLYYAYVTLTNSTREGARTGANNPIDTASIKARVQQEAAGVLNLDASDPNAIVIKCAPYSDTPPFTYLSANCSSATAGDRIQVKVNYNFEFVTLYLFGIKNFALTNSTSMAIIKKP